MFVFSFKNFRLYFTCALLLLAGFASVFEVRQSPGAPDASVLSSLRAEEESLCRSFLQSKGWSVSDISPEISEVTVPEKFNNVYSAYNELQKLQGFDLAPYCGTTVKKYVFILTEYPGAARDDPVRATLLLCEGRIVGGDISSVRSNGFMHGFSFETADYEFYPT